MSTNRRIYNYELNSSELNGTYETGLIDSMQ